MRTDLDCLELLHRLEPREPAAHEIYGVGAVTRSEPIRLTHRQANERRDLAKLLIESVFEKLAALGVTVKDVGPHGRFVYLHPDAT